MLWLAVHLPDWPLQHFLRGRLHPQALAVVADRRILAVDPAASEHGIRPGQHLAAALALAPTLQLRARQPQAERQLLTHTAAALSRFTPQLAIDPPDALLLDIEASLRLFGGLPSLLQALADELDALGLHGQLAVAPTALAARWLACARPGSRVEHWSQLPHALQALPLNRLPLPPAVQALLAGSGIRTLGQAQELPRAALAHRDARPLIDLLDRAFGRQPDPRAFFVPPPGFDARIELLVPQPHSEALLFLSRRLLHACTAQLAAAQLGMEHFRLSLEHDEAPVTEVDIHLGSPSRDEARCLLLLREHLARLTLPAPATALRLSSHGWESLAGHSQDLFDTRHHRPGARPLLIERLRLRLGTEAVCTLSARADHRPEHSQCAHPPGGPAGAIPQRGRRPVWLFDMAQPLRQRGQQPYHNGPLHVLCGPERIEAGWWNEADAPHERRPTDSVRDYYIARGAAGELLWIYRELHPPYGWFLHGLFA